MGISHMPTLAAMLATTGQKAANSRHAKPAAAHTVRRWDTRHTRHIYCASALCIHEAMVGRPDRAFEGVSAKFPRELLERIDDFRYTRRIPSRAETIRQLIEAGLEASSPGLGPRASPSRQR
jgi:hypothetical protein